VPALVFLSSASGRPFFYKSGEFFKDVDPELYKQWRTMTMNMVATVTQIKGIKR
jgi:hypothetical protein